MKKIWGGDYALLLVADGAGGHDAGDKAAEAVVAGFNRGFPEKGKAPTDGDPGRWIRDTIVSSHADVKALGHGQSRPPASTVVGMVVERKSLCAWRFHVGDSRLYARAEDGMVAQWTRDHNITNGLIDRGLPVTQALKIADGGRLTQVLGGGSDPEPEILGPLKLEQGQVFLLCSDGIYGHNGDREVLLPAMNPESGTVTERVRDLKVAVLDGDAPDNLTAVLWQVPDDAVATFERETVTNSMKAVTAADIARHMGEAEEAAAASGGGAPKPSSSQDSGSGMGLFLVAAVVGVLLFAWAQKNKPPIEPPTPPPPPPAETPAETPSPADLGGLPWPSDPESADRLAALVGGFDGTWWDPLTMDQKSARVSLLADLVAADVGDDVTLIYVDEPNGPTVEATFPGWKLADADGRARATRGWAAREEILATRPTLAAQPGIDALMADAACRHVQLAWPRVDGAMVDTTLGAWLVACLPTDLEPRSVEVRLGGWPDVGWSMDDLNRVRFMALKDRGGAELADVSRAENPRVAELGMLAGALTREFLAHVEVDINVVQSRQDIPEASTPEEAELLVRGRATEMAALIRGAAGSDVQIAANGWVADDLAAATTLEGMSDEQQARLADLNRRVEVVVRSVSDSPNEEPEEELPGEVEQVEEAELPDDPGEQPAAPAEPETAPAEPETAPAEPETAPAEPESTPAEAADDDDSSASTK